MERNYPINILIVDDHPENLLAIEALLEGEPYRLIRAYSGNDALRSILQEEIALILLDVRMPVMDGFETARLIKAYERFKHIPIIFITAKSKETGDFSVGYSAGAIDYMVKPFQPHVLKAKIQGFVSLYDAQKTLKQQAKLLEQTNRDLVRTAERLIRAEAQASVVMETSLDTMIIFTSAGVILQVNPAVEQMFGYSRDELVGRDISRLLPLSLPVSEGASHVERLGVLSEVELQDKDGRVFFGEMQIGASSADPSLLACTIRDITQRKAAERDIVAAKDVAEHALQVKTDFLSFLSHEIRTPLNGVIGMLDLLLESDLTEKQNGLAEVAMKGGHMLLSIINNVLDFSRLESGKLELEDEPFLLVSCLEQVRDIFTAQLQEKRLELAYRLDPRLPDAVRGDMGRLRQVLLNLIGNAVKFTESGGIYVKVELAQRTEEAVTLAFTVRDTGIGIPADKMDRLFQPFSQASASTNRQYGGSGLGLSISRTLVELMGGSIHAESGEEGGATFAFTVRMKSCDDYDAAGDCGGQLTG